MLPLRTCTQPTGQGQASERCDNNFWGRAVEKRHASGKTYGKPGKRRSEKGICETISTSLTLCRALSIEKTNNHHLVNRQVWDTVKLAIDGVPFLEVAAAMSRARRFEMERGSMIGSGVIKVHEEGISRAKFRTSRTIHTYAMSANQIVKKLK